MRFNSAAPSARVDLLVIASFVAFGLVMTAGLIRSVPAATFGGPSAIMQSFEQSP
jgi:hypothetical protein